MQSGGLTELKIKALKAKEKEYSVFDNDGLSIRVLPSGKKSFQYRYRLPGWENSQSKRYIYKPDYPTLSLKVARAKHSESLKKVAAGIDLNQEKNNAQLSRQADLTVAKAFKEYDERYLLKELRAPERQLQYFKKDILPVIGKMKAKDVTRRHLIMILDRIVDRGAPIQANRTLSALKRFFGYCVGRGILNDSPALQISKSEVGGKETPRKRFFTIEEIRTLWERIDTAPFSNQVQLVLKILLLTGQRVGEICNAEWSEIDFENKIWTIPEEKSKNGEQNRIPLHEMALGCFRELDSFAVYYNPEPKHSRYVCQSPQVRKQIKGDRKSKNIINEAPIVYTAVNRAVKRHQDYFKIEKWVPHDLRRTVATQLNELGVLPHVVEKILNHKMQGVMAVYNKAEYWQERVDALKLWQEKIRQIISVENVIAINRKREVT